MLKTCTVGDHESCPDTLDDKGICSCPCHLDSTPRFDLVVETIVNAIPPKGL